jgi:hypothetical protein
VRKCFIGLMSVIVVMTLASRVHASNVGFGLSVNVGNVPDPVYASPPVAIDDPPEFVAQPALGLYAAVGTPYDLFYSSNRYYLCRGNIWYAAPYYNGPWVQIGYRALPWGLRRYPMARMRYMRDEEPSHYVDDDRYEYRYFRPERTDWRDRQARWGGEKPCAMDRYRHDRHWENDDDD